MSSQAVYRAGLVAPLLGSGSVITTSSEERELARSISVRRRCLQTLLTRVLKLMSLSKIISFSFNNFEHRQMQQFFCFSCYSYQSQL